MDDEQDEDEYISNQKLVDEDSQDLVDEDAEDMSADLNGDDFQNTDELDDS